MCYFTLVTPTLSCTFKQLKIFLHAVNFYLKCIETESQTFVVLQGSWYANLLKC